MPGTRMDFSAVKAAIHRKLIQKLDLERLPVLVYFYGGGTDGSGFRDGIPVGGSTVSNKDSVVKLSCPLRRISTASMTGGLPTMATRRPPMARLCRNASASTGTDPVSRIAS